MNNILKRGNIRIVGWAVVLILVLGACTPAQKQSTMTPTTLATTETLPVPLATTTPTPYLEPRQRLAETSTSLVLPAATPAVTNDGRFQAGGAAGESAASSPPIPWGTPPPVQSLTTDSFGFSTGGSATVNDAPYDSTFFKNYGVNPFIDTEDDQLSTFAMDVDTAAYTVARRFVSDGFFPDPDSVRVEEFINYFKQEYEPPTEDAFAIHIEAAPSAFGSEKHWLMRVGLQGKIIDSEERDDASLVFVIDISGSMARENRLGLVKNALGLLVGELRPSDTVGIVVYGSTASVLLEPTEGGDLRSIMEAIDALQPGGSTNAAHGLRLGYEMAERLIGPGRTTRVVLLSDGVANVGNTGSGSILNDVRRYVDRGSGSRPSDSAWGITTTY